MAVTHHARSEAGRMIECSCGDLFVSGTSVADAIDRFGQHVRERASAESLFAEITTWSLATFGESTFASTLTHFIKELHEFYDSPHDRLERSDLVFLLIQLARIDGDDLLEAIRDKFEINKARTWQPPDADGVVEHQRG